MGMIGASEKSRDAVELRWGKEPSAGPRFRRISRKVVGMKMA